ncbi:MAG: chromophore lyase CpcT/CpeT [Phycisphaeraceae bacterium]|nr:chromophore lyase CpcT/CpeT [Phycisphaeraceae bacterium]
MHRFMLVVALAAAALALPACNTGEFRSNGDIAVLTDFMAGSFSSAKQAEKDPENFRDIRLEMARIWPDRADGVWLYVEQAVATSLDRPYRQRVYRLTANADGTLRSDVYTLPEPALRFAGAWREPARLADLTPQQLDLKDGCAITLTWHPCSSLFTGTTTGTGCESTLQGAAYATSEASINAYGMITWDRGFDRAGNQVWGSTAGGYVFVKQGVDR